MQHRLAAVLLLTGALLTSVAWTDDSWAQAKIARVGILTFIAVTDDPTLRLWFEPFRRTLADQGWVEGKNVAFEYRSALGDPTQLAEAAAEVVRLKVDVIFADSAPGVRAAHAATRTIPIVAIDFTNDPVAEGYVESYGRPGGNLTGVFLDAPEFAGKWIELLRAMVPGLSRVAVLWDPSLAPRTCKQFKVLRDPSAFSSRFSRCASRTTSTRLSLRSAESPRPSSSCLRQ